MPRVECQVTEIDIVNDEGKEIPGVSVECPECERSEESYGLTLRSVKRCLALLKEDCDCDNYLIPEF